jgi:hypothetical protein
MRRAEWAWTAKRSAEPGSAAGSALGGGSGVREKSRLAA